jgi:hypothetical protein
MKKINVGDKVIYSGYYFYSDLEVGVGILTSKNNGTHHNQKNTLIVEYLINYETDKNIQLIGKSHANRERKLPDSFLCPYNVLAEKRIFSYIKKFSKNVEKLPPNYNKQKEIEKLFKKGKRNFYFWLFIYNLKNRIEPIYDFTKNVIIKGTLWIVFGSIISLYSLFYQKNKVLKNIKRLKLLDSLMPDRQNKNSFQVELLEEENNKESIDKKINDSKNFILVLVLSIASLIISIISLGNK